jgi:hypothetical protein
MQPRCRKKIAAKCHGDVQHHIFGGLKSASTMLKHGKTTWKTKRTELDDGDDGWYFKTRRSMCSCFSGLNMTQKVRWHIAMAEVFFIELDTATLIDLDTATF